MTIVMMRMTASTSVAKGQRVVVHLPALEARSQALAVIRLSFPTRRRHGAAPPLRPLLLVVAQELGQVQVQAQLADLLQIDGPPSHHPRPAARSGEGSRRGRGGQRWPACAYSLRQQKPQAQRHGGFPSRLRVLASQPAATCVQIHCTLCAPVVRLPG